MTGCVHNINSYNGGLLTWSCVAVGCPHFFLIPVLVICRLHVFFGCYHNLFRLMAKCGVLENLLLKEHTHTFVNTGV